MDLLAGLNLLTLAAGAILLPLVGAHLWYHRWCDRNDVPRTAGSTSTDGISCSDGDGGGD